MCATHMMPTSWHQCVDHMLMPIIDLNLLLIVGDEGASTFTPIDIEMHGVNNRVQALDIAHMPLNLKPTCQ